MHHQFSQKLADRLIQYFLVRHKIVLSTEEAQEYLRTYAEVFLVFVNEEVAGEIRSRPELRGVGAGGLPSPRTDAMKWRSARDSSLT